MYHNYGITQETFVDVWEDSVSVGEVVKKLTDLARSTGHLAANEPNISKKIVSARASIYRGKKVNLKKMPKDNKHRRLKVDELNERIRRKREGTTV